jgi:hypothetical protein
VAYEPKIIFHLYNPYACALDAYTYYLSFKNQEADILTIQHSAKNSITKADVLDTIDLPQPWAVTCHQAFQPGERIQVVSLLPKRLAPLKLGANSIETLIFKLEAQNMAPIGVKGYADFGNGSGMPIEYQGSRRFGRLSSSSPLIRVADFKGQSIHLSIQYDVNRVPQQLLPILKYPLSTASDLFWAYHHPNWPLKAVENILLGQSSLNSADQYDLKQLYAPFLDDFYTDGEGAHLGKGYAKNIINLNSGSIKDWMHALDEIAITVSADQQLLLATDLAHYSKINRPFFSLSDWFLGKGGSIGAAPLLHEKGVAFRDFLSALGTGGYVREEGLKIKVQLSSLNQSRAVAEKIYLSNPLGIMSF